MWRLRHVDHLVVWKKTIDGRTPRTGRTTGLTQEQVDWPYEQLHPIVEWDAATGRPRSLSLYTALVMVLFRLQHNLPDDLIAKIFGCSNGTVSNYQDELEPLIDVFLTPTV